MSYTRTVYIKTGMPVATCIFLALLVLKVAHVIDISWVWVFAPYWIGLAAALAVVGVFGAILLLAFVFAWIAEKVLNR